MARRVLVNGQFVDKAGASVTSDDEIRVAELEHPWVGRGGMKLAQATQSFTIDLHDKVCADIGASTGGFTDVMLKHGARKVYATCYAQRPVLRSVCGSIRYCRMRRSTSHGPMKWGSSTWRSKR